MPALSISHKILALENQAYDEPQKAQDVSFYGKRFKALRVTGSFLYSVIASLFATILSGCNWLIRRKNAHLYYRDLASYHWHRGWNHVGAYHYFKSRVINFTLNARKPERHTSVQNLNISKAFGQELDRRKKLATSELIPIDPKRYKLPHRGVCMGMSLDFISHYLRNQKTIADPLDNIKQVSQLFAEGATREAQMTQMLHHAQKTEKLTTMTHKQKKNEAKQLIKRMESLKAELNSLNRKKGLPRKESYQLLVNLKRINHKVDELGSEIKKLNKKYEVIRYKKMLHQLGLIHHLKLKDHITLLDENLSIKQTPEDFQNYIDKLSAGAYILSLHSATANHAMVYIKSDQKTGFVHDPNFATVKLVERQHATDLWRQSKRFYNEKGDCSMTFFKCNLKG